MTSWNYLPADVREIAEQVLTPKQLEAFKLELAGYGTRSMSAALDIDRRAVKDRLDAAARRLRRAGVRQTPTGDWTIERAA